MPCNYKEKVSFCRGKLKTRTNADPVEYAAIERIRNMRQIRSLCRCHLQTCEDQCQEPEKIS